MLVRISPAGTSAQLLEAEANAAQLEARLGLKPGEPFDPARVPDALNAKAALDLAEAEFARIGSLLDQRVVSKSDTINARPRSMPRASSTKWRRTSRSSPTDCSKRRVARVALARKASADTVIRAPFAGQVAERIVSVGDYVTRGARVATVVRVDPMRIELTVPEQSVSLVKVGQPVRVTVEAYLVRRSTPLSSSCPPHSGRISVR